MLVAPDNITSLKPNEIFVYGANRRFAHGRGAAKQALQFGARYGEGPFCGQTYGICTKDARIKTLPLVEINIHVEDFLSFAAYHDDAVFLVTAIGTGLAALKAEDIAPMFRRASPNVALPQSFIDILNA